MPLEKFGWFNLDSRINKSITRAYSMANYPADWIRP